jgi:Putative beta barrel porin-7 (BBP7)
MHKNGKVYPACDAGKSKPNSKKSEGWQKMKREKLLASGAWLLMVSAIVAQSPVDGGKVPSPLSPYGQIGSAVIKKEQVTNEKKDLELPAMEVDKVPIGAIPREGAAPLYPRFFLGGEYLAWKLNNTTVNPIVFNVPEGLLQTAPTTISFDQNGGPQSIVSVSNNSSLLLQSQAQLSQNSIVDYGMQSGMRFSAGYYLEQDSGLSVNGNFILVPKNSYYLSSVTGLNDFPVLLETGFNNSLNFTIPSNIAGQAPTMVTQNYAIVLSRQVDSSIFANASTYIAGGELNVRGKDFLIGDMNFSGLLGFRYFQFKEAFDVSSQYTIFRPNGVTDVQNINVNGNVVSAPIALNYPTPININSASNDQIKVYNHFIGPQIGINADYHYNRWSVMTGFNLGIGVMHQVAKISSSTTQTVKTETSTQNAAGQITSTTNTSTTNSAGGLLFSPVDVGQYSRNQFGLLPEINAKLGFKATERIKLTVGYDFLLLANVLRAPNQTQLIPYSNNLNYTANNQTQSANQTLQIPAFQYSTSNLIINGVTAGLQLDF